MAAQLSETFFKESLQRAYRSGVIASTDGYAEMYENIWLKCAAVLIPLAWWKDEWNIIFTRRTETVDHHKGQVAFPGGGCELNETTPEETALREADEEIGLKPGDTHLLGRLNDILTITGYRVTPVVGVVPWPYEIRLEPAEVVRVFTIPLLWLADRKNWDEQPVMVKNAQRPIPVIRYLPYDGEVLWGASARMIQNFLSVLGLLKI